ncbi:YDG domain-containing protein [Acetobacterium wieringae]|uniref:YDG domain-containing protein n=1 Tax=Acetobacterium wieringae TaxID=52694 RepID=UPI0026EE1218|nr:YDG domain-containing protein [Acetobacterium wieringae]
MKKGIISLLLMLLLLSAAQVFAASDMGTDSVFSRGHIENIGDFPTDGSWVQSPNRIGTAGESKRIEGFEFKLGGGLPSDMEIRYNVHVQNIGWIYDKEDLGTWAKNGEYAGTRGECLRIEAIRIVLTDANGNLYPGYHIKYRGHIQNIGDMPEDASQWIADGEQLGTVGSSLRLEALTLEIVKDEPTGADLSSYNKLCSQFASLTASNYTLNSFNHLTNVLKNNTVTAKNTQDEVDAAVAVIEAAFARLESLIDATVYATAGTFGPETGLETIDSDVIMTASGVTLQNLRINGNLIVDEAVGDGEVTLNNIEVTGELRVRGGGKNSIHINGGKMTTIRVEQTPTGAVRIVSVGLNGTEVVLCKDATGETLVLEGAFSQVTVEAPGITLTTQGNTRINALNLTATAQNTSVNLAASSSVRNLSIGAPANIIGSGTVTNANIAADHVVFQNAPLNYTVDPGVTDPPVIPPLDSGGTGGGGSTPDKISLSVITPPAISDKTYDGTTATNVTAQALDPSVVSGIVSGDSVTVYATATYCDQNAGSGKTVAITYHLTGINAGRYEQPANSTTTAAISPVALGIRMITSGAAKTYDGSSVAKNLEGLIEPLAATDQVVFQADFGASMIEGGNGKNGINIKGEYYTAASSSEKAVFGSDLAVKGTAYLSGKATQNYVFNRDVYLAAGEIKPGTVWFYPGNLETIKIYDGTVDVSGSGASFDVAPVSGDEAKLTVSGRYLNSAAGNNRIRVMYELTGAEANRYVLSDSVPRLIDGLIVPKKLAITPPAVGSTKVYDGKPATDMEGLAIDNAMISGFIGTDSKYVKVTATAIYEDKNVGATQPVTISYCLTGTGAGNYEAPEDKTTAAITARPLSLENVSIETQRKFESGNTGAQLLLLPILAGVIVAEDTMMAEDVYLKTCEANYYNLEERSDAIGEHTICLSGTLGGADAGNYSLDTSAYDTNGEILAAVMTATFINENWGEWLNNSATFTAPEDNFKLFYKDENNFYGIDEEGAIYYASDLNSWQPYCDADSNPVTVTVGTSRLIGIDKEGTVLAVDASGQIESWDGTTWVPKTTVSVSLSGIVNPTYYQNGTDEYLIAQANDGSVYRQAFDPSDTTEPVPETLALSSEILAPSCPPLPAGFDKALYYYDGAILQSFCY